MVDDSLMALHALAQKVILVWVQTPYPTENPKLCEAHSHIVAQNTF